MRGVKARLSRGRAHARRDFNPSRAKVAGASLLNALVVFDTGREEAVELACAWIREWLEAAPPSKVVTAVASIRRSARRQGSMRSTGGS